MAKLEGHSWGVNHDCATGFYLTGLNSCSPFMKSLECTAKVHTDYSKRLKSDLRFIVFVPVLL